MYKCITQVCSVFKEKIYIHAGMLFGGISVVLRPICVQMASNKWWSTENVDWEFETCFSSGAPMGEIQGSDSDKTGPWGTFTAKWNHRSYFLRNCEGEKKKHIGPWRGREPVSAQRQIFMIHEELCGYWWDFSSAAVHFDWHKHFHSFFSALFL